MPNFRADQVFHVCIPESKNNYKQVDVLTIKDKVLQMLMKLVMEPYLEPMADTGSFGFRSSRNTHHATRHVHNIITWRIFSQVKKLRKLFLSFVTRRIKNLCNEKQSLISLVHKNNTRDLIKEKQGIRYRKKNKTPKNFYTIMTPEKHHEKTERYFFYKTQFILDATIEVCSDNVTHQWLIENIPMPSGYEYLLSKNLQTNIVESNKSKKYLNFNSEVFLKHVTSTRIIVSKKCKSQRMPQEDFIAPLLIN
jgi:retron-type reverse transcriptase